MKKRFGERHVAALLLVALLAAGIGIAVAAGGARVAAQIVPTATVPPPTDTPTGTPSLPPPTDTPTFTPTPDIPIGPPHAIEFWANPDEVVCDGQHPASVTVRLMDAYLRPVADGTPVYFFVAQGFVQPDVTTTSTGWVNADVYPNNQGGYGSVLLQVDSGRVEAFLRILCMPPAEGCTPVPWPESPPAISPPQTPCPTVTPQPPQSPPQCDGSTSPPCPTDTPVPPVSPPECGGVTSPPCSTATPTPVAPQCPWPSLPPCTQTPTPSPTSTPTPTPAPDACADVTGDHRVDWRDVFAIARHMSRRHANLRYDLNHDGVVDTYDVQIAVRQIGRRC